MPYNTSKRVQWAMNTESDLAGYIVYYGTSSGVYSSLSTGVLLSGDGSTGLPNKVISGLSDNTTYYFAVTAYDQTGNESTFSAEVSVTPRVPLTRVLKQRV